LAARLVSKDAGMTRGFILARYSFYLGAVALSLWFGVGKLAVLYWFVPLFTWLILIFRVRSIAEHSAVKTNGRFYGTRTTLASFLDQIFIAPKNVNYHLEHHLYPSVPFYRLPKLHALLALNPEFQSAHITRTYFGVLRECVEGPPAKSSGAANPQLATLSLRTSAGGFSS